MKRFPGKCEVSVFHTHMFSFRGTITEICFLPCNTYITHIAGCQTKEQIQQPQDIRWNNLHQGGQRVALEPQRALKQLESARIHQGPAVRSPSAETAATGSH